MRLSSETILSAALGVTLAAGELIFESPYYIRDAADELFRVAGYFLLGVPVAVLLASRSPVSLRGREKSRSC
jgi:hypothetical protein